MDVNYFLCDPTGNITALVESEVPLDKQAEVGEKIMQKESVCEQVGFIMPAVSGSDITLRMAGGEFCGNATMSAAALFCKRSGMQSGEKKTVLVKTSGAKDIVNVEVSREKEKYYGTVEMPVPLKIEDFKFIFEGHNYWYPTVHFQGISHVIIEDEVPFYMPERCIKYWCDMLHAEGLGLMLLNEDKTELRPLVYIKDPESLVWESSCGSGTTAVGAYFAKKTGKPVKMSLKEPGGILTVETFQDGKIKLSGVVEF